MGFSLKSIMPYLAGAGASGVASQFSALQPFQAAIGAGAGALANSKNRLAGAAQGAVGGGVGSSLAGGVKGLFSGGTGGALQNFGSGAMSGLKSFSGSIPGFGGVGTSAPQGVFAKMFTPQSMTSQANVLKNGTPYFAPAAGGGYNPTGVKLPSAGTPNSNFMNTASGTGGTSVTGSMNPMEMFKNMIPGAAVAGMGSLLAPTPDAPDYSGVRNDLMNRATVGGNPEARAAALKQYLSTVQAPEGASAEAGIANARLINDRQKADAQRALEQQFRANNGNIMGNSAYNDALTKSNTTYDQNYAAQAAQLQFEYDNQQKAQKMAAANALQGMDQAQLQQYADIANLDIQSIQEKFQLSAGEAQSIKDIGMQAGALMMQKGLGL